MKKKSFLLSLVVLLTITSAFSQIRKVPSDVTEAFKAKFPDAKNVSWSDKITSFEAAFDLEKEKLQSNFSAKGEWKKTEKQLKVTEIPATIKEGYDLTKYAGEWTIKSATEINEAGGKQEYRLSIEKSALQKKNIYLNVDGSLIREAVTL